MSKLEQKFTSRFEARPEARPRRNRKSQAIRSLMRETTLNPSNLILPLFLKEGKEVRESIKSMPGVYRQSLDQCFVTIKESLEHGVQAIALFPVINEIKKDKYATESKNKNGLLHQSIKAIKDAFPEVLVITDVAMDPYSSDGHDGLVRDGKILNDETLEILCEQALSQAEVGADFVAPSDMMDGRVGVIRKALDENGFIETGILSYCAKYASSFYGPFREALNSAPRFGDKKTYQMDPANSREALREARLDAFEGADILMVKPGLPYLDVIAKLKSHTDLPIAAYQVSGEYAMVMAAHQNGWLDGAKVMMESLLCFRRAGADMILTYYALEAAKILKQESGLC